jgi:hypothetical protein
MYYQQVTGIRSGLNSESVPVCDHWDLLEKRPRHPAPYLIQDVRHPSTAGIQTIRSRIREISIAAGARRSDRADNREATA